MQLDLGKLKVKNSFSWHGDKDSDPSAVHLDILLAKVCMNIFQGCATILLSVLTCVFV